MGCVSSLAAEDAEYTEARGLLQKGSRGDFEGEFSVGRLIGRGGFSRVHSVRRRADQEPLAVKVVSLGIRPECLDSGKPCSLHREKGMLMQEVVGELAAWSAVSGSRHVVGLVSAMVADHQVLMVMERCESHILHRVSHSPGFWALESRRVMREMLLGVQACHLADIVHRDVKPQNFLLGADGSTVKLCDFGLAVRMPRHGQLRGRAGTIPFTSPEMLSGSRYGTATDMWSYGVMAYFLCFGEYPFCPDTPTCECMKKAILLGQPMRHLARGGGAAAFIGRQLERCKSARCTVEEALAHWYLQEEDTPADAETPKLRSSSRASEATTAGPGQDLEQAASRAESTTTGGSTPSPLDDGPWSP